jgi:hypothetical protein
MLLEKELVAINPRFSKLLTSLRTAVEHDDAVLEKTVNII